MSEIKIIGLSAPAGFSINEYLKSHPANSKIVSEFEKEILKHIKDFYPKGIKPNYSDWYAGMTDKTHSRYKAHKKSRNIEDLPNYKKFYLYSMSNARMLESRLFKKYGMGNSNTTGGIYIHSKYVYVFHEQNARLKSLL
ncbi:hypothetical protein ACNR9Q_15050 [Maribacter sp. X9]|uniref:hypothetical protein n=1 Tax=Maribacter sp. X9 TaxID=3402159 RepID=UPI003AF38826